MSEKPTRDCVHCGEPMPPDVALCRECGNRQVPRWWARLTSHPLWRLVQVGLLGALASVAGLVFQEEAAQHALRMERTRDLVQSSIELQTLAEGFQRPCPIDEGDEESCSFWFDRSLGEFGRLAYVFKDSSRHLLDQYDSDAPIHQAIDFIDDFFNPGALDLGRMPVFPVQIELLRSRDLLTMPPAEAEEVWCEPEARARVRALAASLDTWRYCYKAVRSFASEEAGRGWFESRFTPRREWPESESARTRLENCSRPDALEDRAARIAELLVFEKRENYAASWHYDTRCGESPGADLGEGLIPPATEQLLVVLTEGWDASTGRARRLERRVGGGWERVGEPVDVNVGRSGLAWGRGLHPFPGLGVGRHPGEGSTRPPAPKREGDGRAPAGLFRLGGAWFRPDAAPLAPAVAARLDARPIDPSMHCEDRGELPDYNRPVRLSAEERAACELVGRCPERLHREDSAYDAFVWVEHNPEGVPGAGSCIFLHVEKGGGVPTAGCTSAPAAALGEVLDWLRPDRVPLLLQLPRAEYERRAAAWNLPPVALLEG